MKGRTQQVSFRMPERTYKALKLALLYDGKSMTDFLNQAVEAYIRQKGIDLVTLKRTEQ